MEKKRNLNIEVLRVVSMFMVIVLHALGHGGVLDYYQLGDSGYFIFWLIEAFCMVAVNCFVLITGYFGWKSNFKLSRVVKFYTEIFLFYVKMEARKTTIILSFLAYRELF